MCIRDRLGCRSAAEVQARRGELCQTAYECGLYHDLGKCAVLMLSLIHI